MWMSFRNGEVTLDDIVAAQRRIGPYVRRTALMSSAGVSRRIGARAYLKLELFQKTGSFKPRGAFNKAIESGLRPGDRVVAVSGGNHAQGVAYAARELGLRATILMPRSTPENYLEAARAYGAEIVLVSDIAQAFDALPAYEREGAVAIHPFDDPLVIAGQGTIGLEIMEDLPEVTDVVVSIGGGGLIAGVAVAIRSIKPAVRIWGVETSGADAMSQAMEAGRPVRLPAITSIAKTLGAPEVSPRTLELARRYIENVTVVSDAEAVRALRFLLERAKVLTEPAAACTLAAAERLREQLDPHGHAVLLLCGGNIAAADLCGFMAAS
jgi:threonine dehydratase